jgi:MmyB-like transcription regulator ligand binding domain
LWTAATRSGPKDLHHPVVGDLRLSFEAMELPADPGLSLVVYSAEPGSPSADALNLLASWAATLERSDETAAAEPAHEAEGPLPGAVARPEP